jgi:hypothetical protein
LINAFSVTSRRRRGTILPFVGPRARDPEHDSIFNIASAYAQKYCGEIREQGAQPPTNSENLKRALEKLKEALRGELDYAETVRAKWTEKGESFDCFADDKEFRIESSVFVWEQLVIFL